MFIYTITPNVQYTHINTNRSANNVHKTQFSIIQSLNEVPSSFCNHLAITSIVHISWRVLHPYAIGICIFRIRWLLLLLECSFFSSVVCWAKMHERLMNLALPERFSLSLGDARKRSHPPTNYKCAFFVNQIVWSDTEHWRCKRIFVTFQQKRCDHLS